jgi:enoyl-CoA hydratase/carnithine racemase
VTDSLLDARREGDVCVLTLQRPEKLNALSAALERSLAEAIATDEVRSSACVVVAGAGRAFSAGADITEFADRDPEAILRYYRDTGRIYEDIAALSQPTISAVHGYCLGGGLELALATDFRIADETAVLGFPEVGLGILPSSGGTVRAARLLGAAQAKRLILLGGRVGAAEALAIGLVTEVVAEGRALERSLELARGLAELPAAALSVAKQAIDAAAEASPAAAHLIERLAYGLLAQTPAAREAAEGFGGGS